MLRDDGRELSGVTPDLLYFLILHDLASIFQPWPNQVVPNPLLHSHSLEKWKQGCFIKIIVEGTYICLKQLY